VVSGGSLTASYLVVNRGTVKVSETYTDRLYLSTDATLGASDVMLGTSHGHTADLSPNATHSHSKSIAVPAGTAPGSYYVLVQADAFAAVSEASETNNVSAVPLSVSGP
jgi:subtilase family serine protease